LRLCDRDKFRLEGWPERIGVGKGRSHLTDLNPS